MSLVNIKDARFIIADGYLFALSLLELTED